MLCRGHLESHAPEGIGLSSDLSRVNCREEEGKSFKIPNCIRNNKDQMSVSRINYFYN